MADANEQHASLDPSGTQAGRGPNLRDRKEASGARLAACKAVARAARAFPDVHALEVETDGLDPRDAALAHAIVRACILRWHTLAAICEKSLRRSFDKLDPLVQAALLAGAAQLVFFDRVPAYAAVDESVAWIKRHKPDAAGVVNAGLRGVARLVGGAAADRPGAGQLKRWIAPVWDDEQRGQVPLSTGGALRLIEDVFPKDRTKRLAAALGVPLALYNDWQRHHGPVEARRLGLHLLIDPPTVLCATFADERARALLDGCTLAHAQAGHMVYTGEPARLGEVLSASPTLWAQDASSTLAVQGLVEVLSQREGSPLVVLDWCAGLGTKTRQLAMSLRDATIIATDPDEERFATLQRVGALYANVRVVPADAARAQVRDAGGAHAVLLDVPCSNSGVLPRRPEALHRQSTQPIRRMVELQQQILKDAAGLVRRGGVVAYATCSIDARENQAQAAWAVANLGWRLLRERAILPDGVAGDAPTQYRDGAFHAVLEA